MDTVQVGEEYVATESEKEYMEQYRAQQVSLNAMLIQVQRMQTELLTQHGKFWDDFRKRSGFSATTEINYIYATSRFVIASVGSEKCK